MVVAIPYLGTAAAPLKSIDLLLAPNGGSSTPMVVQVYAHHTGDAKPACPALNTYTLPVSIPGVKTDTRVVGVRLRPTQDRVPNKGALMQVCAQPAYHVGACSNHMG